MNIIQKSNQNYTNRCHSNLKTSDQTNQNNSLQNVSEIDVIRQYMGLEKRNEEVEAKFAQVSKSNLDLQKTERELRDQVATSTPKSALDQLASTLKVRSPP